MVLWLLHVHAFVTLSLVGLIWFVQWVHYPLMARVGEGRFRDYQARHMRRTTWVVAPLMLTELACAATLAVLFLGSDSRLLSGLTWVGIGLVAVLWLFTAAVQVPLHRRLERGFDAALHRRLVRTNWIRTGLWSVRGLVSLAILELGRDVAKGFPGGIPG